MRILLFLLMLCCAVQAEPTPDTTARNFYNWLQQRGEHASKHLAEAERWLTPELYSQLTRAYAKDPNEGEFLDFDPFSNTQMGASGYRLGPARLVSGQAKVPVTVLILGGGTTRYTCVLTQGGADWRVANLVYGKDFDLLTVLRELNK